MDTWPEAATATMYTYIYGKNMEKMMKGAATRLIFYYLDEILFKIRPRQYIK